MRRFVSAMMRLFILSLCTGGVLSLPVNAAAVIPNTGDTSNILLWIILLAAAFLGLLILLIILLVKRRKSNSHGKHYR